MPLIAYLVEDNKAFQQMLVPTLQSLADIEVTAIAEREFEACRWLKANSHWELVVIDLLLEQGSGLGVLAAVENRQPHQKAVVLSNYCTPITRERCKLLGADRIFEKSTEQDEFLAYCHALAEKQPA